MLLEIIVWATTALCVVGVILNAQEKISGFYVWMVSNFSLVLINIHYKFYAQAVLFTFYIFMCFYGIYKWKQNAKERKND